MLISSTPAPIRISPSPEPILLPPAPAPIIISPAQAAILTKQHHGKPAFIRIIKEDLLLELWVQDPVEKRWRIIKSYPILGMSGTLGPKTAEGDYQAPEGFYAVRVGALNPKSRYHLSFNIGYPNAYDRSKGYTGSFIMVHGSDCSIGCFAMGDPAIEEIYYLVEQSLKKGQRSIPVQVYPFAMTEQRMEKEQDSPHYAFWREIQAGWLHTELEQQPYPH